VLALSPVTYIYNRPELPAGTQVGLIAEHMLIGAMKELKADNDNRWDEMQT
jgi:hypothetical protein